MTILRRFAHALALFAALFMQTAPYAEAQQLARSVQFTDYQASSEQISDAVKHLASLPGPRRSLLSGANTSQPAAYANFLNGVLPNWISFARAGNANSFDASGNLVYAPNNQITNSAAAGAVAGTPGTAPTGWTINNNGNVGTLAITIVGTGTESGLPYIEFTVSGTPAGAGFFQAVFSGNTSISAALGQSWISTNYFRTSGGSTTGLSQFTTAINEYNSSGTFLTNSSQGLTPSSSYTRQSYSRAIVNSSTAYTVTSIAFTYSAVAINYTFRIALPQLSLVTAAQSSIPDMPATTSAAYYGPRFDYDPSTLAAKGLLLEGARTNSITNGTAQGAVAGTARVTGSAIAISRTASATAVAVMATHNFSVGDLVTISGATGTNASEYNGTFAVTAVVASTSFSYVTATSRTDSVTGASVSGLSQGTFATNWGTSLQTNLTAVSLGSGTTKGISYQIVRVAGLALSVGTTNYITSSQSTYVTAAQNQVWNQSAFFALASGSWTNINLLAFESRERSAGGSYLAGSVGPDLHSSVTSTLTRFNYTSTLTNASTANLQTNYFFTAGSTGQVDFTLWIGLGQAEQLSSASQTASSPIPTTGSALTRAADIATITGVPATILASSQGTALVETTQTSAGTGTNSRLLSGNLNYIIANNVGGPGISTNGTVILFTAGSSPPWASGTRIAFGFNSAGRSLTATGSTLGTDTNLARVQSAFYLGSDGSGNLTADGWYSRAAFWASRQSDARLSQLVVLGAPLSASNDNVPNWLTNKYANDNVPAAITRRRYAMGN